MIEYNSKFKKEIVQNTVKYFNFRLVNGTLMPKSKNPSELLTEQEVLDIYNVIVDTIGILLKSPFTRILKIRHIGNFVVSRTRIATLIRKMNARLIYLQEKINYPHRINSILQFDFSFYATIKYQFEQLNKLGLKKFHSIKKTGKFNPVNIDNKPLNNKQ